MSKRTQLLSDVDYYKLELADGADYLIDLGSDGTLELTGNLSVSGNVTQTEVNEIVVTDNTIRLNNGETGIGVTAGTSGIEIDRGVADDAEFVFDESLFTLRDGAQFAGAFVARTANSNPLSIYAAGLSGFAGDDIYIKPDNGTVKISESGIELYERRIFPYTGDDITPNPSNPNGLSDPVDQNILVNVQSVIDYIDGFYTYNFQDRIQAGNSLTGTPTSVRIFEQEVSVLETSRIEFTVDDTLVGKITELQSEIFDIKFANNIISPVSISGDLVLKGGSLDGNVQVDGYLNFTEEADPDAPSAGSVLYSKTLGDGGTGVYFKNTDGTQDELVSRNKALLYSIIF
jgi:hypothetical protein